jgi:integrase/recombinase XerD
MKKHKEIKEKGSKVKAKPLPIEVSKEEFRRIQKTIQYLPKKRKYFIANLLAWGSGLRISEVCNLKKRDFNFEDGTLRINLGKNSKDRIVPIPKGFTKHELNWIPIGVQPRALQKEFIKACIESGVKKDKPKVHFHSLRHGFATECVRSGMRLEYVQLLMGHEDLQTTSIYINLAPKEAINQYKEKYLTRE